MKYKEKKAIQEEQKLKRNIILVGILILITLGVFLGTSYAVFSMIVEGNKKITIGAGTFAIHRSYGRADSTSSFRVVLVIN